LCGLFDATALRDPLVIRDSGSLSPIPSPGRERGAVIETRGCFRQLRAVEDNKSLVAPLAVSRGVLGDR